MYFAELVDNTQQIAYTIPMNCPICQREMIEGPSIDGHHLIPKTHKGTEKTLMHKICHVKLHSVFTTREMQHYYHTIERLLESDHIQKFIKWVAKKPPEYYEKTKDTRERKGKRRR